MDWKSTAVISGAGILATWFFSMPVAPTPTAPAANRVSAQRAAPAADSSIDIQREAARLQARVRTDGQYAAPLRNPFRFGNRRVPAAATSRALAAPTTVPVSLPPKILLDGIATDVIDGQEQRTAILNTNAGMLLVKIGEQVAGYRVEKIGTDAVDLVKTSDGSVLHVAFR